MEQERVQEAARMRAMERDRDINDLISRARVLTMDVEDFLVAVDGIVVTGESRQKGGELLATASQPDSLGAAHGTGSQFGSPGFLVAPGQGGTV
jgi:hypothetical protein